MDDKFEITVLTSPKEVRSVMDQIASLNGFVIGSVFKMNYRCNSALSKDECIETASLAMEDALNKADKFDPSRGKVEALLWTITRNMYYKVLKSNNKKAKMLVPLELESRDNDGEFIINPEVLGIASSDCAPDADIVSREEYEEAIRRERVRAAKVAKLSERDQFILHELAKSRSYKEIGEALGVKPESVGKLVSDARRRVKKLLEKSDYLVNDFTEE